MPRGTRCNVGATQKLARSCSSNVHHISPSQTPWVSDSLFIHYIHYIYLFIYLSTAAILYAYGLVFAYATARINPRTQNPGLNKLGGEAL